MITGCGLTIGRDDHGASGRHAVTVWSQLFGRLTLGASERPNPEERRHATWLELFFDLVFVLALILVVERLGDDAAPGWRDVGVTVGLFMLVWWAWTGQAFYDTRFDPDDTLHRLLVLLVMAGAGAIAAGIPEAPDTLLLPIGYLVVRGTLLVLYLRVIDGDRAALEIVTVYLVGFGAGWLLWLGSLAAPANIRPVIWIVAFVIELATPWVGKRRLVRLPVDTSHLPERIGQFTILLLGATLTRLLEVVSGRPSLATALAAAVAFTVPAAVWWIYTTYVTSRLVVPRLSGGQAYTYLHGPFGAALIFLGWALSEVVRRVAGEVPLPPSLRGLLAASIWTWMLCGLGLHLVSTGALSTEHVVLLVLGLGGTATIAAAVTHPLLTLILMAVVLVAYTTGVVRHIARVGRATGAEVGAAGNEP